MPESVAKRPDLRAVPLLTHESLYIGIDVGKAKHVAGFVSTTLLSRHQRFEACPALMFENSREGFHSLVERIRTYAPLEHCFVLLEKTGHYHKALQQFLQELDIPVYMIHVQERPKGMMKTDKRDALGLANTLYTQLALGAQVADKTLLARRAVPPTETAAQLKGLIRHRYELVRESTQRKNKLISICDELFPEFTRVLKDPTLPTALALRGRFPTPHAIATASLSTLREVRVKNFPSEAQLVELQQLASQSIGTKDLLRQRGLVLEQTQLIRELKLIQEHIEQLEREIKAIVEQAREGKILASMGMGAVQAATIIAAIGSIYNFPSAATLKSYFGWAPTVTQSGSTLDHSGLTRGGTRTMKQIMFLIVAHATQRRESEWAKLYERLVKAKCPYDERTARYKGKVCVMGRIAGQMIEVMYVLLKKDAEVLSKVPPGTTPPEPILYDQAIHQAHRNGTYRSQKPTYKRETIVVLPKPSS